MNALFNSLILKEQNKIMCLARNYLKDAILKGAKDLPTYPLVFGKAWSSLIYEPNPVRIKCRDGHICDHEVELGVVIGKTCKNIKKKDYLDYIQAYFVCLDLTDRKFLADSRKTGMPWFMCKSPDSYLPVSKFLGRDEVKDPHNLDLTLYINDKVRQHDNTGNMYFKIDETMEFISKYVTMHPGDLILTGTPTGIGPINVGEKLKANLKQNGKVIMEMKYDVEDADKVKH